MDKLRLSRIPLMMIALLLAGCGSQRYSGFPPPDDDCQKNGVCNAHLSPLLFDRKIGMDFVISGAEIYQAPAEIYVNYSDTRVWAPLQPSDEGLHSWPVETVTARLK